MDQAPASGLGSAIGYHRCGAGARGFRTVLAFQVGSGSPAVYALDVTDRFGDYGTTGLVFAHRVDDATWDLDTVLLSCRVLGRGVESALLRVVTADLIEAGARRLTARPERGQGADAELDRAISTGDEPAVAPIDLEPPPSGVPRGVIVDDGEIDSAPP